MSLMIDLLTLIYPQQSLSSARIMWIAIGFFSLVKKNERYDAFWKLESKKQFSHLRDFAQKMYSMFGST